MSITETRVLRDRRYGAVLAIPLACLLIGTILRYGLYEASDHGAGFGRYLRALCVLDCDWYETIVRTGYDLRPARHDLSDGANWAFFPLLPLVVSGVAEMIGGNVLAAAFVVSTAATLATALLAWQCCAGSLRAYGLFCVFLFIGPFSYHFSTLYTESLFMALTLAAFLALRRRDYIGAGAVGALLSATRLSGVFLALSMALTALLDARRAGLPLRQSMAGLLRRNDIILGILLAPVGLFCFMAFLYVHVGDALAFSHIQRSWGRVLGNPLGYLWDGLTQAPGPGQWIGYNQSWAIAALVGFGLCAELLRRREWALALFCGLTLLVPLCTEIFSMTRFLVGLAPLMILAMTLLARNVFVAIVAGALFIASDILLLPLWTAASYYLM